MSTAPSFDDLLATLRIIADMRDHAAVLTAFKGQARNVKLGPNERDALARLLCCVERLTPGCPAPAVLCWDFRAESYEEFDARMRKLRRQMVPHDPGPDEAPDTGLVLAVEPAVAVPVKAPAMPDLFGAAE